MRRFRRRASVLHLLLALGCSSGDPEAGAAGTDDDAAAAISLTDARGVALRLHAPAVRVLSLVPSVTETFHRLGADGLLVGRTDYDTLSSLLHLPTVGGGLGPNLEVVRTLEPQVVISFAGDSDPRTSRGLAAFGIPEFAVRPDRAEDVTSIVRQMGVLVGREAAAEALAEDLEGELRDVADAVRDLPRLDAVYLLGGSPPLAAGPGTFISDLMELAGARNALGDLTGLYAPVSPEVLRDRRVDVLLVGEGSAVDPRVTRGRRVERIPSWVEIPGPRLGEAAWLVARAVRPELREGPE